MLRFWKLLQVTSRVALSSISQLEHTFLSLWLLSWQQSRMQGLPQNHSPAVLPVWMPHISLYPHIRHKISRQSQVSPNTLGSISKHCISCSLSSFNTLWRALLPLTVLRRGRAHSRPSTSSWDQQEATRSSFVLPDIGHHQAQSLGLEQDCLADSSLTLPSEPALNVPCQGKQSTSPKH